MSFEAYDRKVSDLLNNAIYRIPRNQRGYVWKKQNWDDLFDDITIAANIKGAPGHFLGSMVLKRENIERGLDVYEIIDGQQRILSLTVLIAAVMFELKRRGMLDDFKGTLKNLQATDNKGQPVSIVDSETHHSIPKLIRKLVGLDADTARRSTARTLAQSCIVNKRLDQDVMKAFERFCDRAKDLSDDKLVEFRDATLAVCYISVEANTDEDAYTIFEILNARGTALDDHELLKNFILRYLQPVDKRDEAKEIWRNVQERVDDRMSEYLRHYAIHRFKYNSSTDESVYKKIQADTKRDKVEELLDDIADKALLYRLMQRPEEAVGKEREVFQFFKSHRVRQFRPLLLSLAHCHELGMINDSDYAVTLQFIRDFYICYKVICDGDGNNLTDSIAKHAYALEMSRSCGDDAAFRSMLSAFRQKLPSWDTFKSSVATLGFSKKWPVFQGKKAKERCALILETLEQSKSVRPLGEYTIEHVLPDYEDESHAQLGNLLLLEPELNEVCGSRHLAEKLSCYAQSSYSLTRRFAERYSTSNFDPNVRTEAIAKELYGLVIPDCNKQ